MNEVLTFDDYTRLAARTAVFPPEAGPYYTALGLCSEVGELAEANAAMDASGVRAELGDALWYVAMLARTHHLRIGFHLQRVEPRHDGDELFIKIVALSGYVAGRVKKRIRDGADSVPDKVITDALLALLDIMAQAATYLGTDLATIAKENLAKLADRAERGVLRGSGDHR